MPCASGVICACKEWGVKGCRRSSAILFWPLWKADFNKYISTAIINELAPLLARTTFESSNFRVSVVVSDDRHVANRHVITRIIYFIVLRLAKGNCFEKLELELEMPLLASSSVHQPNVTGTICLYVFFWHGRRQFKDVRTCNWKNVQSVNGWNRNTKTKVILIHK